MKINRKGFTLVELLATIVIVGLVLGVSTYGILTAINNSKEKAATISTVSLKETARIYSAEASSDSWKKAEDYDFFCVTINELMNKGLIEKDAKFENNITKDNYIIVKRNNITLAVESEEVLTDNDNNICTGTITGES